MLKVDSYCISIAVLQNAIGLCKYDPMFVFFFFYLIHYCILFFSPHSFPLEMTSSALYYIL